MNFEFNTERLMERQADLLRAIDRLSEACEQPLNSFVRDSVIQRFEFCWELAWKSLKLRLEQLGVLTLNPRDTFREAVNKGIIQDGNAWSDLQKYRNMTSHTYNEALADDVYAYVRETGLGLFQELGREARTWTAQN